MNKQLLAFGLAMALIMSVAGSAFAEPFDTPHRIHFGPGFHAFWPEEDEQEGSKPDQDGFVTDAEFEYIFDEGYDISDYNGLTFELGYEYLFVHWFGLGFTMGWYGGTNGYDFQIEGIDAETEIMVRVFHIDLLPRFHWQTRWTDLYGGPVVGLYNGAAKFDITVNWQDFEWHDSDTDQDTGFGGGLNLGFEFRINERWGLALEGRSVIARLFTEREHTNEWFNAGGNNLMLFCVVHL